MCLKGELGSILVHVLFTLYINDLPSCVQFSSTMMYADDTVIYFTSSNLSKLELKMNLGLINLSRWLDFKNLILNIEKTECEVFGTRQRLASQNSDTIELNVHGQSIKRADTFNYQGVVLNSTLSFNDHIEHLRKKLSKVLGVFSRARPALTLESANRFYTAMVLPILDYCDNRVVRVR